MTPFNNGYVSVAVAAVFWGTIGLFVKILGGMGLSIETIVFIRLFYGCLILAAIMFIKSGSYFKVDLKGLILLGLMGVFTQAAFNLVYFKTIEIIGVASAAVLLYVAPVLIILLSKLIFKEILNPFKKIGLVICLLGAFMAITGGHMETLNMDQKGILLGLSSAVIYAMLSITSKIAIERYDPLTVIFYSFLFGTIAISPFVPHSDFVTIFSKTDVVMLSFTMGLVPAAFAYFSYFRGIGQKIDLSIVSVISTLELLVSVLIGRLFLNESITTLKLVGLSLIVISIFISQYQGHKVNKRLI